LIISSVLVPGFFVLLDIAAVFLVSLEGLVRAEFTRTKFRVHQGGACARRVEPRHHVPPSASECHGGDATFLPFTSALTMLTALDFLGLGLPPGSPSLGELLAQGKANIQAPWLGLCGFFSVAVMLSLLIFAGEAVRDAFDPRRTFA
jgi:microcin C transport system permease protein